jgi:hypothetical protein
MSDDSTSYPPRFHRKTGVGLPCSLGARKKNILPKGKSNLNLRVVEEGAKWWKEDERLRVVSAVQRFCLYCDG